MMLHHDKTTASLALACACRRDNPQIGFVDLSRGFADRLRLKLPNARLVELPANVDYFKRAHRQLDALLISAESGSAFTLFYPDFEVVVPDGNRRVYQVGMPGPRDEETWGDVLITRYDVLHAQDVHPLTGVGDG